MSKTKQDLIFLLSIDTEEEWNWNGAFPESDFVVNNLQVLPEFQGFCNELGIRPSYLFDYAAANLLEPDGEFMEQVRDNKCEIGAHLHPWANPPYFDKPTESNSHVVNLPIDQVTEKLDELIRLFAERFGYRPKSFRTGRWGITPQVMQLLWSRGFDIDSSVYPFYENDFFNCHGSPTRPYWPDTSDVLALGKQRDILEIPVTVGFNRTPFDYVSRIYDFCETPNLQMLKANGFLWSLGALRKIYMSPEVNEAEDMISLADKAIQENGPLVHMYFHSSNLIENGTGFFDSANPLGDICSRIEKVIAHLNQEYNVVFATLSEAKVHFSNNPHFIQNEH